MIKKILSEIEKAQTIIVQHHITPDGDAYGSSIGLKKAIQLNYPDKTVYVVGDDQPEDLVQEFGLMDQISDDVYNDALVIVTDCANVERIDDQRYKLGKKLIKIDHHPNVTSYGDLVWVDTSFTSASEMIAFFVYENNFKINQEIGQIIFYGIVTDSLRFGIAATSTRTFMLATYLTQTGFDLYALYQRMYNKDLSTLQVKSELIHTMKLEKAVGSVYLTQDLMDKYNIPVSENGSYSNLLKDIDGIDIWVSFGARPDGKWRVEFRSKGIAINGVAQKWGGGGHKQASGAIINSLDDAPKVIADLQALIK